MTSAYYHYSLGRDRIADYVSQGRDNGRSVWMVPGTYNAEADAPPPKIIATMFGLPFDVKSWHIKLGDGFYSASTLRMMADVMDDNRDTYNAGSGPYVREPRGRCPSCEKYFDHPTSQCPTCNCALHFPARGV